MGYSMTVKGEMMLENGKSMPSVDAWLREAKADVSAADCGMYLTHNGVVRDAQVRGAWGRDRWCGAWT